MNTVHSLALLLYYQHDEFQYPSLISFSTMQRFSPSVLVALHTLHEYQSLQHVQLVQTTSAHNSLVFIILPAHLIIIPQVFLVHFFHCLL